MGFRGSLAALFVTLVWASPAAAEPRPYRGAHPIDHRGHWHDEASAHVHDDLPVGVAPFADVEGVMVFLADPEAYGYSGIVWAYTGAHPLPLVVGGYCGISGVHRHPWAPEGRYRENSRGEFTFSGALRGGQRTYVPGRVEPTRAQARGVRDATLPDVGDPGYGACVRYRERRGGRLVSVEVGDCHGGGVRVETRRVTRAPRAMGSPREPASTRPERREGERSRARPPRQRRGAATVVRHVIAPSMTTAPR